MTDQNSQFFAILTAVGEAKQANANALGVPWTFAQMGVGDANLTDPVPARTQTRLINERRRAPLNQVKVDPANASIIIAEQVIPPDVGGWWIREIGLYDVDGDLVAVASCAPSFKPLLSQGTGKTQVVRLNIIVTSTANIQLRIDPAVVLATREYVDSRVMKVATQPEVDEGADNLKAVTSKTLATKLGTLWRGANEENYGVVKLATQPEVDEGADNLKAVTSKTLAAKLGTLWRGANEESYGVVKLATQPEVDEGADNLKAVTSKTLAVKLGTLWRGANEENFGVVKLATQHEVDEGADNLKAVTSKTLAAKLGTLWRGANEENFGVVKLATQPEVDAGADNLKAVTSKTLAVKLGTLWRGANEVDFGVVKLATQPEVNAGSDDAKAVTSRKLRLGFSSMFGTRGHIALPSWLGGLVINWGLETSIPMATDATSALGPTRDVTLSLAFPNQGFGALCSMAFHTMAVPSARAPGATLLSKSVVRVQNNYTASAGDIFWVAFGN